MQAIFRQTYLKALRARLIMSATKWHTSCPIGYLDQSLNDKKNACKAICFCNIGHLTNTIGRSAYASMAADLGPVRMSTV